MSSALGRLQEVGVEAKRTFLILSFTLLTLLALTASCDGLGNQNSVRWEPCPEGNAV